MRSLERALDVLEVLSENGRPLRLSEVARRAELHVATTQRILNVLVARGFVEQDAAGYRPGPATLPPAQSFLAGNGLAQAARPILEELAAETGMTATLYVRLGASRVLIGRVEGTAPLRYQLPIGARLPLHLGAGKVLAAALPDEERAALIEQLGEFPLASGDRVTPDRFRDELDLIARRGYQTSVSERVLDAASVAAPVIVDDTVVAALQVTWLATDHPADAEESAVPEVRRAAAAIAARYRV
jgi:IclR family acetate operon transcriptional repressor